MPVVSTFYGITVSIHFLDDRQHKRPHLHARFQGDEVVLAIPDGEVLEGAIPPGKLRLLLAWMEIHSGELMVAWELAVRAETFPKIRPLR